MVVHHVDRPVQPRSRVVMTMHAGPFKTRWNVVVRECIPPRRFTDEQIPGQGPFKSWIHTHSFEAVGIQTRVTDHLQYEPPFGVIDKIADALFGGIAMKLMFVSRSNATRKLLESLPAVQVGCI